MSNLESSKGIVVYEAGKVIFHEGDISKHMYLVKKGEIRLIKKIGQHLSVVGVCQDKDILNEISTITNKPTEFSAIAKTDIELVLVDQKDILAVINGSETWVSDMFNTLCERLKTTRDLIHEHNLDASEKLSTYILTKEEESRYMEALQKK